jgi:hypothetical protein
MGAREAADTLAQLAQLTDFVEAPLMSPFGPLLEVRRGRHPAR